MASPGKAEAWQQVADVGFESAFHFLLGRLVHAIARLDFGMGLQLRYWGREDDPKIQELLEPQSAKLKGRLKALERLMKAAWAQPNTEGEPSGSNAHTKREVSAMTMLTADGASLGSTWRPRLAGFVTRHLY